MAQFVIFYMWMSRAVLTEWRQGLKQKLSQAIMAYDWDYLLTGQLKLTSCIFYFLQKKVETRLSKERRIDSHLATSSHILNN